jgi:hypothetical protein
MLNGNITGFGLRYLQIRAEALNPHARNAPRETSAASAARLIDAVGAVTPETILQRFATAKDEQGPEQWYNGAASRFSSAAIFTPTTTVSIITCPAVVVRRRSDPTPDRVADAV